MSRTQRGDQIRVIIDSYRLIRIMSLGQSDGTRTRLTYGCGIFLSFSFFFFFLLRPMEGDVLSYLSQEVDKDCASAILVICLTT